MPTGTEPNAVNYNQLRDKWMEDINNIMLKLFSEFHERGLPDNLKDNQLYKQAGNSVSVPVIKAVAEEMWKALNS